MSQHAGSSHLLSRGEPAIDIGGLFDKSADLRKDLTRDCERSFLDVPMIRNVELMDFDSGNIWPIISSRKFLEVGSLIS